MNINEISTEQLEQELAKRKEAKDQELKLTNALNKARANPLKSEVKTVVSVDHFRLEEFVQKVFGANLEFACVEQMSNDTDKEICNVGCGPDACRNDGNDNKNVEDFLFGRKRDLDNWSTNCLLEWLAVRDFIPKGDYLISVSW
jgi:hypothetical protein